jgi:hypothetical protein
MTLATVVGYDVTAENYETRPLAGQIALYVTGTTDIIATSAMLAANPDAITINQSGGTTIADMYDVESGAVTPAELPGLIRQARTARLTGNRRRNPGAYVNQSNLTPVVNELVSAKMTNVPLWVADYNLSLAEAISALQSSSGPYPIVGYQYADVGTHDEDVWLASWVSQVSQTGVQLNWAHCNKCQGLFYAPYIAQSECPAGGPHTAGASWDYGLGYRAYTTS